LNEKELERYYFWARLLTALRIYGITGALCFWLSYWIIPNLKLAAVQSLVVMLLGARTFIQNERCQALFKRVKPQGLTATVEQTHLLGVEITQRKIFWKDEFGQAAAKYLPSNSERYKPISELNLLLFSDPQKDIVALQAGSQTIPNLVHSEVASSKLIATTALIAITFLVYLFSVHLNLLALAKPDYLETLKLGASVGVIDEPWRLVTCAFLHASWWHLVLNMLALRWLGLICETQLGPLKLAVLYFSCAIGSGIASAFVYSSCVLSMGASGAIMGLGGFIVALGYQRKSLLKSIISRQYVRGTADMIIVFALSGLLVPHLVSGIQVDNAAHFGGLISGILGANILLQGSKKRRLIALSLFLIAICTFWILASIRYHEAGVHIARSMLAISRDQPDEALKEARLVDVNDEKSQKTWRWLPVPTTAKDSQSSLLNNISWVFSKKEKYDEAIELSTLALKSRTSEIFFDTRAVAYMGKMDYEHARSDLQESLRLKPGYDAAEFHLAQLNLLKPVSGNANSGTKSNFSYEPEPWEYRFGKP
jgi:rhomboid protease GluP